MPKPLAMSPPNPLFLPFPALPILLWAAQADSQQWARGSTQLQQEKPIKRHAGARDHEPRAT